ncbi:MAG: TlpA family protein disulfide reductase [Marmoricola sp.]|nr:TlpA family protein disulfide reductase [Marmoricola sp.]
MTRTRGTAVIAVVLLLGAVLSACAGGIDGTGDKGYIDGKGIITELPVAQRKAPGPVEGKTLEGKQISLADYRGKVVVINVWWSQCGPCRAEASDLNAAARELTPKGVVFFGINTRDASQALGKAYERNQKVPYPSLYDDDGSVLLAFHSTLPPNAIPSTVILDKQGRVAASILGQIPSTTTLVDLVQDASK